MMKAEILDLLLMAIKEVSTDRFSEDNFSSDITNDMSVASLQGITWENCKDSFFVDLGINSIDYAEVATIVMEKLHVDVPLEDFAKTNRISEAVDLLHAAKAIRPLEPMHHIAHNYQGCPA